MEYYLKEMREKFAKYPESLCLRNGIHAIETKLGLPNTVSPICPIKLLAVLAESNL
jgi:hypothetical protein